VEKTALSNITGLTIVNDTAAVLIADQALHVYNYRTGTLLASFRINDKIRRQENWQLLGMDTSATAKTFVQRQELNSPVSAPRIIAPAVPVNTTTIAIAYEYYLPGTIHENNDTVHVESESKYFIAQVDVTSGRTTANNPVELYFKDGFQSVPDISFGYFNQSYYMGGFIPTNPQELPVPFAVRYALQGTTIKPQEPIFIQSLKLEAGLHKYSVSGSNGRLSLAFQNGIYDLAGGRQLYVLDSLTGKQKEIMAHALLNDGAYVLYGVVNAAGTFDYYEAFVSKEKHTTQKLAERSIVDIYRDTCYKIEKEKDGLFIKSYFLR
jgi:hypothetical protein